MSLRWLFPTSFIVALVSAGTLLAACADESTSGCDGACAHEWTVCQADISAESSSQTFQSTCLDTCRSTARAHARDLATALDCVNGAQDCDSVRSCTVFGTLAGPPGVSGFGGFGGFGGFATGGFVSAGGFVGVGGFFETGGIPAGGGSPGCSDGCFYAHNGLCDDGGPNASTARCLFATDCSDCGVRGFGTGGGGFGGSRGRDAGAADSGVGGACTNTCFYARNGQCEDGGLNSIASLCVYGTDCDDCGVRIETGGAGGSAGADGGSVLCTTTCVPSGNARCDDGGPGATTSLCAYGTDCNDCGARPFASNGAAGSPATVCAETCSLSNNGVCNDDGTTCNLGTDCVDCGVRTTPGSALCTDSCTFSADGACEDGGFGAVEALCEIGTDCSDCGPR